jgi:hypothetical protein
MLVKLDFLKGSTDSHFDKLNALLLQCLSSRLSEISGDGANLVAPESEDTGDNGTALVASRTENSDNFGHVDYFDIDLVDLILLWKWIYNC